MSVIYPPPRRKCVLPNPDKYLIQSIGQCSTCPQWFFVARGDYGKSWIPLRWYHWRLKRWLRAQTETDAL